jgi:hypothetical protein
MVNKRGGAEKGELFVSPKADSQKMIKADKVVHVGMGDEDVTDFQHFSRGKGVKVSHIEKEGPSIKHEFDIKPGVAKGIMDQLCMEQGFHGRWQGVISKNYSFFSVKLLYNL